jgi:hypothetical protein
MPLLPSTVQNTIALTPKLPKSAAAIRAQIWRDKQKQDNPDFKKKEAMRKQAERADAERERQLEETLKSGQFPTVLSRLRYKPGKGLFLKNAPRGLGKIETGGYDTAKINTVVTEQERAKGGKSIFRAPAKSFRPEGHGPDSTEPDIPSSYIYIRPKEVRILYNFIRERTTESPMLVCLICQEQISPEFSFGAGYNHFHGRHPDEYKQMMALILPVRQCPEDHSGMAETHGKGAQKLYCG